MLLLHKALYRLRVILRRLRDNWEIERLAIRLGKHFPPAKQLDPVILFIASSGTTDFTYNGAFNLLAAWGLRLAGVPVIHFACQAGMLHCVLGTNRNKPYDPPPCRECIRHSQAKLKGADVHWFSFEQDESLAEALQDLNLIELAAFEYHHTFNGLPSPLPLGALVTPGLRWILRRLHLQDDEPTRYLYRDYILSAWNVARRFAALLEQSHPQAVIVFNGQFYPEAVAAWVTRKRNVRVVTHEVGLQPFSAFFTEGEATAYPIHIPADFELNHEQNARLDGYLEKRFQGQFSMAGVRFWQHIKGLDEAFIEKSAQFKQIVPVFTNVIFDTSQPHANTVFPDMFNWLELIVDLMRNHPETLFVIRAHPDETRPGKVSQETVRNWVAEHNVTSYPNVVFIAPGEYLSSYELIQRSKFVMVYNSTIGLEAAIMGAPVLCGGKARFTQYPIVFFPQSAKDFRQKAEEFLEAGRIDVPAEFRRNARRFLYYQLFRTSLPFDPFLRTSSQPSLTRFRYFPWEQLLPENSPAIAAIVQGILDQGDFLLES
jgi:hypothetical protein